MNLTREDVELDFLEDLFEHEAKCESPSCLTGQFKCVHEVVALRKAHEFTHRVCQTIVNFDGICSLCGSWSKDCWTITPI